MTLIPPSAVLLDPTNIEIISWGPMTAGDTCVPTARGDLVDRSVQCEGTFTNAATIFFQGSNDATSTTNGNYHTLNDPFSNPISFSASGIKQVTEVTAWMKPVLSNGDVATSITVTVAVRRSFR
jgi:hypothetical protein